MKILVDTDIILDLALGRQSFSDDAEKLFNLMQTKKLRGFVAWHTISNFFYIFSAMGGAKMAREFIGEMMEFVTVVKTGSEDVRVALGLQGMKDFEDALQVAAALKGGVEFVVTRNLRDFKGGPVRAVGAKEVVEKVV